MPSQSQHGFYIIKLRGMIAATEANIGCEQIQPLHGKNSSSGVGHRRSVVNFRGSERLVAPEEEILELLAVGSASLEFVEIGR